jgi:hypothetical protein
MHIRIYQVTRKSHRRRDVMKKNPQKLGNRSFYFKKNSMQTTSYRALVVVV